jgi:hypothetical protein
MVEKMEKGRLAILSILDINMKKQSKHIRKTVLIYLILSIIAIVINKIYAIFAHGVSSEAMTWMFLYPLIGGSLFYSLILVFANCIVRFNGYRMFFNIYNSGIAILTFGSFLKGIIDIAGADSKHLIFYYVIGILFVVIGLILIFIMLITKDKAKQF